jgi:hypothetical protein
MISVNAAIVALFLVLAAGFIIGFGVGYDLGKSRGDKLKRDAKGRFTR